MKDKDEIQRLSSLFSPEKSQPYLELKYHGQRQRCVRPSNLGCFLKVLGFLNVISLHLQSIIYPLMV
jgi:hypothetical protein